MINKLRILISSILLISLFACKKSDQISTSESSQLSVTEKKFFQNNRSSNATEAALANFVYRKNLKEKFVETAVQRVGYPHWNKAVDISVAGKGQRPGLDSTYNTFLIPFSRDSQNYVNSVMVLKTNGIDTLISYLSDWQYSHLENSTSTSADSSEYYSVFFMILNKHVFGQDTYAIQDSDLFYNSGKAARFVKLTSSPSAGKSQLLSPIEYCQDVTVYFTDCPFQGNPNAEVCNDADGCDQCNLCTSHYSYEYCWIGYIDVGGGGGSGGGGNTGSGGGNSGGTGFPPNCGVPILSKKTNLRDDCLPGWNPGVVLTPAQMNILDQLSAIAGPRDSYFFSNELVPSQCLTFSSVSAFQTYLQNNKNAFYGDLSTPATIINQNEKIEHAKFNLILVGGVDVSCKLTRDANATWQLNTVTSTEYGLTLGWSWEQINYAQSIVGNDIVLIVEGYIRYNIFVDGWGTVYKEKEKFTIKINRTTGKITSVSR